MIEYRETALQSMVRFIVFIYSVALAYINALRTLLKPPTRKSVKDQNVLITGSGHGLGRLLALKLARQGANLVLVDINKANNEAVKQEILKSNPKSSLSVLTYSVDIRLEAEVADLAERVRNDLGNIDILINNAGIVQCLPFLELSPALVERTFQVNTFAHIWTIKHFLPAMLKNKRGHIVAIASVAGLIGTKFLTDYCSSKFAVIGLMDSLEKEIHDGGINEDVHLTTICPASMSTGMFQSFTTRFKWLFPVLEAEDVASRTIDAMLANKPLVVVPPTMLFAYKLSSVLPPKVNFLIQEYLDYGVKPHKN